MSDLRSVLSLVRRVVRYELNLYLSLIRWVARRPSVPGGGVEAFGYAQAVTPVMWLWIFASAMEMPLFHVLVPWESVRIIGLVLGGWGLVWMIGLLASLRIYPHLLDDTALRVRHGSTVEITVPWDAVATIKAERRDLPSTVRTLQPREAGDGTDLQVGVSGQVNVHAVLRRPLTVRTPKGPAVITELSFLTDDPRALVRRARQQLDSAAGGHTDVPAGTHAVSRASQSARNRPSP